jgi:HlyD family secretion protein
LAEAMVRLEQAELNRSRGTMTSPVDGVVLNRLVTSEGHLPAGTKLLEIGRLEELEVEADVLSVDVVGVKPGHQVEIYGPAIGTPAARGTVARIFPAGFSKVSSLGVEQQRVKVVVRFNANELERLRRERNLGVSYRVRVKIETAEKPDALAVPRSALFRGPYGVWQLYAVRRGHAEIAEIRVGILNDDLAEVTEGLAEGDLVIPFPDSNLTDGQRVNPVIRGERATAATTTAQTSRTNGD